MPKRERWEFQKKGYPPNCDFMPLLKFYLLETPVRGVSRRGKDFSELGWNGAAFNTLKAQMLSSSELTNNRWQRVDSGDALADLLRDVHLYEGLSMEHECAYYVRGNRYKVEGLFYLIRNAFAHGSFFCRTVRGISYYALETRREGSLRGRAILREATLLNWKSVVLHPEKYLHKR